MAYFTTDTDLKEYEPDILTYGIQDFDRNPNLHEKTYDDIIRLLNVDWWPTAGFGKYDIKQVGANSKLSPSRLIAAQFKRLSVYHVLSYYIYPRLSTFDPDGDVFREKMLFYKVLPCIQLFILFVILKHKKRRPKPPFNVYEQISNYANDLLDLTKHA